MTRKQKTATPATPDTKKAILDIDGKSYELVYDFNAIADTEKLVECNLLHGMSAAFLNTASAAQLRGLLYAFLQTKHPYLAAANGKPASGISLEQTGHMIRLDTITEVMQAVAKAFQLSIREQKVAA